MYCDLYYRKLIEVYIESYMSYFSIHDLYYHYNDICAMLALAGADIDERYTDAYMDIRHNWDLGAKAHYIYICDDAIIFHMHRPRFNIVRSRLPFYYQARIYRIGKTIAIDDKSQHRTWLYDADRDHHDINRVLYRIGEYVWSSGIGLSIMRIFRYITPNKPEEARRYVCSWWDGMM